MKSSYRGNSLGKWGYLGDDVVILEVRIGVVGGKFYGDFGRT